MTDVRFGLPLGDGTTVPKAPTVPRPRGFAYVTGDQMPTVEEIDEALHHASLVPIDERGKPWAAWVDSLMDQRNRLEPSHANA